MGSSAVTRADERPAIEDVMALSPLQQGLFSMAALTSEPGSAESDDADPYVIAMAADVAEMTLVPRPPKGREEVPVQISRLLHAHEIVLREARTMARLASQQGDDGTNDLLVSNVIRTNEMQAWFVAEHVVDVPLVRADS